MSDTTKHVKVTKGRTVAVTQTSLKNNDLGAVPRDELEKEVSTLRTMVEAMKRSATIDTVSGLANRKSFNVTSSDLFISPRHLLYRVDIFRNGRSSK